MFGQMIEKDYIFNQSRNDDQLDFHIDVERSFYLKDVKIRENFENRPKSLEDVKETRARTRRLVS